MALSLLELKNVLMVFGLAAMDILLPREFHALKALRKRYPRKYKARRNGTMVSKTCMLLNVQGLNGSGAFFHVLSVVRQSNADAVCPCLKCVNHSKVRVA